MSFDINDFFKFFGSIYKVALILFLSGLSLILSNDEIRDAMFLKDFINTYGVYIGFVTIVSGIILLIFGVEKSILFLKNKYKLSKNTKKLIKVFKNLSIEEKNILVHFLVNKTQTSNLGIDFESFQESKPIEMLLAKGYIEKGYVGRTPYYYVNNVLWNVLQEKWQEIFYEQEFHTENNQ